MICPRCGHSIRLNTITELRGKGLKTEFQCPSCHAWLGRNVVISRLKIFGFYLALVTGVFAYFNISSRHILIPVVILAGMLMLTTHMMDQIRIISVPEKPDDSLERQKFR